MNSETAGPKSYESGISLSKIKEARLLFDAIPYYGVVRITVLDPNESEQTKATYLGLVSTEENDNPILVIPLFQSELKNKLSYINLKGETQFGMDLLTLLRNTLVLRNKEYGHYEPKSKNSLMPFLDYLDVILNENTLPIFFDYRKENHLLLIDERPEQIQTPSNPGHELANLESYFKLINGIFPNLQFEFLSPETVVQLLQS